MICARCGEDEGNEDYYCDHCGSCGHCGCCPCYVVGCEWCDLDGIREGERVAEYHDRIDAEWERETGEPKRSSVQQLEMDEYIIRMQDIVDKRNGKNRSN